MGRAYAYLRKSSVRNLATDKAPETQEREVRALASRHGDTIADDCLLADWDVSGRDHATKKRVQYLELKAAITDGRCSAVYSYSLSRLGRSTPELLGLFTLCKAKRVPVRLVADPVDTGESGGSTGQMLVGMLALVAEFEANVASERQHARNLTKRLRGESLRTRKLYGEMPGQDVEVVRRAVKETGSYSRAAKLLNARGTPARNGKPWWASSVRHVYLRIEPNTPHPGQGRRARSTFALSRLLVCPTCGRFLTGGNTPQRRYACRYAESTPHPRTSIAESKVLPWVVERTTGYVLGDRKVDSSIERTDLGVQRERLVDLVQDGSLSKEAFRTRVEKIDRAIEKLDAKAQAPESIDWTAAADVVNSQLRRLLWGIALGPDFQPVALQLRWEDGPVVRWSDTPPEPRDVAGSRPIVGDDPDPEAVSQAALYISRRFADRME